MVTADTIIRYVVYTPYNPNKAVLRSLLETYLEDNGGGGTTLEDKVIVLPSINGNTNITPEEPNPGDTVTIQPVPNVGYIVSSVVVVDINGNEIEVTDNGDGTYSYIQPTDGSSVIPVVDYNSETINPDDIVIYDGGAPSGW